jgi:hypothetical protein
VRACTCKPETPTELLRRREVDYGSAGEEGECQRQREGDDEDDDGRRHPARLRRRAHMATVSFLCRLVRALFEQSGSARARRNSSGWSGVSKAAPRAQGESA